VDVDVDVDVEAAAANVVNYTPNQEFLSEFFSNFDPSACRLEMLSSIEIRAVLSDYG
jgi:hypothetical protein